MRACAVCFVAVTAQFVSGCDRGRSSLASAVACARSQAETVTDGRRPVIRPADPPYEDRVILPSGLRLEGLVTNADLSLTYPDAGSARFPFSSQRLVHYHHVEFFIAVGGLPDTQLRERVSENFRLSEYVGIPERNGDLYIYIDPEIAFHTQELRFAWGGPLLLSSTYRSPEYNEQIGGALFSRHLYGDAVDIRASSRQMAQDLYNLARILEVGFLEPASQTIADRDTPWIHIDDRGWAVNTSESR